MPTGSVGPGPCPTGPPGPSGPPGSLVPDIHAQIEFWQLAAYASLPGFASREDFGPEEIAHRAALAADGLTKQWLRRLQQWGQEEAAA